MKVHADGGQALRDYMRHAMAAAVYRHLDDGTSFGEIPGFDGVYANAPSIEQTRLLLGEVLEGWLLLSLERSLPIPAIRGIDLPVRGDVA